MKIGTFPNASRWARLRSRLPTSRCSMRGCSTSLLAWTAGTMVGLMRNALSTKNRFLPTAVRLGCTSLTVNAWNRTRDVLLTSVPSRSQARQTQVVPHLLLGRGQRRWSSNARRARVTSEESRRGRGGAAVHAAGAATANVAAAGGADLLRVVATMMISAWTVCSKTRGGDVEPTGTAGPALRPERLRALVFRVALDQSMLS